VNAKRGDRVAPPPNADEWDVVFGTNEAAKGWIDLCNVAASNTRAAWVTMRTEPAPQQPTARHHRLKGELATGTHRGTSLPQWQMEVTGAGRIWYLVDAARRMVFVMYASPRHPRETD
jgi:hypothetical protein